MYKRSSCWRTVASSSTTSRLGMGTVAGIPEGNGSLADALMNHRGAKGRPGKKRRQMSDSAKQREHSVRLAPGTVARFYPLCRSGPAFLAHMLAFVIAKTSKLSGLSPEDPQSFVA